MAPPGGGNLLITIPPTTIPPLPMTVLGKSSEQERSVLGKKIESIDETPEITQEEAENEETKREELNKETKTFGNGAKKNLKHFTFAKEDMEFKPPKKPCNKGGEKQMALTCLPVLLFLPTFITCLVHMHHFCKLGLATTGTTSSLQLS